MTASTISGVRVSMIALVRPAVIAIGRNAAPLRIGDVAKLAGTTPRTIRYYEEIGLLPAAGEREPGAHRTYSQTDVDRLIEVMRLRTLLGVSLDGLKELVEAEDNREALRREWHEGVADPVRRGPLETAYRSLIQETQASPAVLGALSIVGEGLLQLTTVADGS